METTKLQQLTELKNKIDVLKELEKEYKVLVKEIQDDIPDDWLEHNWYRLSRYIKVTPKLKEWVDEFNMTVDFGDCVKFDTGKFVKEHWDVAGWFVNLKETVVVRCVRAK